MTIHIETTHVETTSNQIPGADLFDQASVNTSQPVPRFEGNQFDLAASAMDFWVGRLTADTVHEDRTLSPREHAAGSQSSLLSDMCMHLPSQDLQADKRLNTWAVVHEILEHTLPEINALPEGHRGHFLAQVLTRWCSDGSLASTRFWVAHLLATYIAVMPKGGTEPGLLDASTQDFPIYVWSTTHGTVLDAVHTDGADEGFTVEHVTEALRLGAVLFPDTLRGVRFLPLAQITEARFYNPDGSWVRVAHRGTADATLAARVW